MVKKNYFGFFRSVKQTVIFYITLDRGKKGR